MHLFTVYCEPQRAKIGSFSSLHVPGTVFGIWQVLSKCFTVMQWYLTGDRFVLQETCGNVQF